MSALELVALTEVFLTFASRWLVDEMRESVPKASCFTTAILFQYLLYTSITSKKYNDYAHLCFLSVSYTVPIANEL